MRGLLCALLIGLAPMLAYAAERPDWAFPVTDKVQPPLPADEQPHTVPGSDKSYTRKQIDDLFNPPDWYPDLHPPMPQIVAHGEGTTVRACASCHLPTGTGHDESAYIAALPVGYFVHEMVDYKSGARKGSGSMTAIAKAISEEDVHAAADYFASLKPRPWIHVVETDTVPRPMWVPVTSGCGCPAARPNRSATASSKFRRTKRSCSTATRAPASSPWCPRAASPRARPLSRPARTKPCHAPSAMGRRCEGSAKFRRSPAGRPTTWCVSCSASRTAPAAAFHRR
jgi:hypothetical protein